MVEIELLQFWHVSVSMAEHWENSIWHLMKRLQYFKAMFSTKIRNPNYKFLKSRRMKAEMRKIDRWADICDAELTAEVVTTKGHLWFDRWKARQRWGGMNGSRAWSRSRITPGWEAVRSMCVIVPFRSLLWGWLKAWIAYGKS